ncbi:MAG TPA: prephenate dehydrogenase/arogenate dehydrogenase family protein [Gammaproteobacteria bacterium]
MIKHLSIIGVGLIGGSLALALKQAGYCRRITGVGRDAARLQGAVAAGVIDDFETDFAAGVKDADMVLVAVPLNSCAEVFEKIRGHLKAGAVLTDAASAKASVIDDARRAFGKVPACFVPGHPIAGTEKSGYEAALTDLFQRRRVILTPLADTDPDAVARVREMWEAAGAIVELTAVEHHDRVLAATSHLPHMLAFGLVDSLAKQDNVEEIFRFAAGGFRDFTRIAGADPVMWRDICLRNRDAILQAIRLYQADLNELVAAIETGDGETLLKIFGRAKAARDKFNG